MYGGDIVRRVAISGRFGVGRIEGSKVYNFQPNTLSLFD